VADVTPKVNSLVQQKFGAAATDYATSTVHARGMSLARLVELTQPQVSWRVLDIATGAGHTALIFAPLVARVTASDVTEEMLAEARKLARERGFSNFKTIRSKAEDLPYPDLSFDLVTCRLAAHHFGDVAAFVREAYRVLMPGGMFALVDNISPDATLLPDSAETELHKLSADYNAFEKLCDPSHRRCLGLGEWTTLLGKSGFTLAHSEWMDQDIEFAPWVERMRCSETTVARLRAMLANEPLRSFLRPRQTGTGPVFTLQEGIILAGKPRGKQG
jgi:ubiquinone/menaquinone biosynthesis C-methylase UbiE